MASKRAIIKRRAAAAREHGLGNTALTWICVAQGLSIAPLLVVLPGWILAIWLLALGWRWQIQVRGWPFPVLAVKLVLGVLTAGGILASYRQIHGFEPMIGFLVCAFALKLIELRSHKDILTILFIGFIAVAVQFLFAQTIFTAAFAVLACVGLVTAWQAAFTTRKKSLLRHFKQGSTLVLQSLPFMVLLFVVMPRLGPLWSVPMPSNSATTGFGDELTLGAIGRLAQSHEPAFRVSFEGPRPSSQEMYWRGLLLEHFDGVVWRQLIQRREAAPVPVLFALPSARYSIILEPHHQPWLFALGVPVSVQSEKLAIELHSGNLLRAQRPVAIKAQYSVESIVDLPAISQPLSEGQLRSLTQLPTGSNPRSEALARSWVAQGLRPAQIIDAALDLYSQNFVYTLQPPVLPQPAIDEFLFGSRAGFCEHFASSFVFLMRSAGVPARVVIGYQGGQFNPLEDYFLVRQSDAHAWAEVWLEDAGWQRVDPTAVVAPSRVEFGVEDALNHDERRLVRSVWQQSDWLYSIHHRLDAVGYSWNRWVLNYDNQTKVGILTRLLGEMSPWRLGFAFVLITSSILMLIWLWPRLHRQQPSRRAEQKLLQRVLVQLQKQGHKRAKEETLGQFFARLDNQSPQQQAALQDISRYYYAIAYGRQALPLAALKQSVERYLKA